MGQSCFGSSPEILDLVVAAGPLSWEETHTYSSNKRDAAHCISAVLFGYTSTDRAFGCSSYVSALISSDKVVFVQHVQ